MRVHNAVRNRPITRKQSALLIDEEVQKWTYWKYVLIELTSNNKKTLVVKYNDLINNWMRKWE